MESQTITKKVRKKEQIIAYHGYYRPSVIARKIRCRREYVYIIFKLCGLDPSFRINPLNDD